MPECAQCGGEVYRYDPVHYTACGVVHDECLCDYLRDLSREIEGSGERCAHCGEELWDEALELEGVFLHADCLSDYVRLSRFPVDYY